MHNCLFMRLHFSIGGYDYRRTARFRQNIHFSITQVLFADHVHRSARVHNNFSILQFKSWCRQALLFFLAEEEEKVSTESQKTNRTALNSHETRESLLGLNFVRCREATISPNAAPRVHQRRGQSTSRRAWQYGPPLFHSLAQEWWLWPRAESGECAQETPGFRRPPSTSFSGQDHKTAPAVAPWQLRVGPLLAQTGCGEGHSISGAGSCARQAISAHRTHHGCVSTPEDPQTVNDDLDASHIAWVRNSEIQIADHPVGGHTPSTFPAYACDGALHCKTAARQNRWTGTCSTVVAKVINGAATPADARRQGNGKAKSAAEVGPETERIDPRQWIGGSGWQESTRTGTTLRTQHRLLRVCEPWEEVQRPELLLHSRRSLVLPTLPRAARFVVLRVEGEDELLRPNFSKMEWRIDGHQQEIKQLLMLKSSSVPLDPLQVCEEVSDDSWMALLHHVQRICPTCPVSGRVGSPGTSETEPTKSKWQRSGFACSGFASVLCNSHHVTQTCPQGSIMCAGELLSQLGLQDFVKVSISALLTSFLLIMCIDAPESTTNSLSSGFNVDAD